MKKLQTTAIKIQKKSKMTDLLKEAVKHFDEKCIHEFRVEVKKLRAAMNLLSIVDKKFDAEKKYKSLQTFFNDLGAIREIQIQEAKLEKDKSLEPSFLKKYHNLLLAEMEERKEIALKHFDDSIEVVYKKRKNQIKEALRDLSYDDFKKYFKIRTNKLKKALSVFDFDIKKAHDLRRIIKEVSFNSRFNPTLANKWLAKRDIDFVVLDDLQKALGDLHDNMVLSQKIAKQEPYLLLQNGENEALLTFKTSMEVESGIIKNHIKKALKMEV
jgi:CHAD domain-containing protein